MSDQKRYSVGPGWYGIVPAGGTRALLLGSDAVFVITHISGQLAIPAITDTGSVFAYGGCIFQVTATTALQNAFAFQHMEMPVAGNDAGLALTAISTGTAPLAFVIAGYWWQASNY